MTWGRAKFELGSILTGKFSVLQQHLVEEYRKVGCNRVLADRWFKRMFKYLEAYDTGLDQPGAEASIRASKRLKCHEKSSSSAAAHWRSLLPRPPPHPPPTPDHPSLPLYLMRNGLDVARISDWQAHQKCKAY